MPEPWEDEWREGPLLRLAVHKNCLQLKKFQRLPNQVLVKLGTGKVLKVLQPCNVI